jgi:hypothetical protein
MQKLNSNETYYLEDDWTIRPIITKNQLKVVIEKEGKVFTAITLIDPSFLGELMD